MYYLLILTQILSLLSPLQPSFRLPIDVIDGESIDAIQLTEIGQFGVQRKSRETIAAHLHTGIDIKRPAKNYHDEKIFPIAAGFVISKRTDGPYAQLLIEHDSEDMIYWTLYEHIAGIEVSLHQKVYPNTPIARFFNFDELNKYGWQFDHFHFEVLKEAPQRLTPSEKNPERRFNSYTLTCFDQETLDRYFYNPIEFLSRMP